jgi:F420-dependent oxidoreductase-like protein
LSRPVWLIIPDAVGRGFEGPGAEAVPVTDKLGLGLNLGYWVRPGDASALVLAAERLGYESVWTAESWGSDALTPLAWYGARTSRIKLGTSVLQISARTPAATAMAAVTLDYLSGGRLLLGIGVSGPQVAEGWYGTPFAQPLARTREYVDLLRVMWRRQRPARSTGRHYPLPYRPGTGLGKPLMLNIPPLRDDIPVYLGAQGPRNVALAAEIADGWLALFTDPQKIGQLYGGALAAAPPGFDIAATVNVILTDDLPAALHTAKQMLGFYIGGMGARTRNFHLDVVSRMGYEEAGRRVQELFLDGRRDDAIDAVPDDLADAVCLLGPIARIRERLQLWRDSPVTTLLVTGPDSEPDLRAIRDAVLG